MGLVVDLLVGLPGERPGGLSLTLFYFLASGFAAIIAGLVYAAIGVTFPKASLPLQAAGAVIRGIPLLLLVFLMAHVAIFPTAGAAFVALLLYSYSHVGETLRSFLASYPTSLSEQARVMGFSPLPDWLQLRIPWTLRKAWAALVTHWISLLKDTGALVLLGIGELTTVAKIYSEVPENYQRWIVPLVLSGALYLGTTLVLIRVLQWTGRENLES